MTHDTVDCSVPGAAAKGSDIGHKGDGAHVGAVLGDSSDEGLHNASVDVEEVIAGHAGLAGHACGNDHEVTALQSGAQLSVADEALNLHQ